MHIMINNAALSIIISKLSMSYFMIQGVDMWGGDLYSTVVTGYNTALQTAKKLINEDSSKCVSFRNIGGDNLQVWVKDVKKPIHPKEPCTLSISASSMDLFADSHANNIHISWIFDNTR
jgi:hypothetical protein